jgi:hypothetical protein
VNHKLHSAAFIEESFGDHDVFARHYAQRALSGAHILDRLLRSATIESALALE